MKFKLPVFLVVCMLFNLASEAQIGLQPLKVNPQIKNYLDKNPGYSWNESGRLKKWGTEDTLFLPFFEDFSQLHIYPDSSRWRNNKVFVNSDLPVRPPSYGAATFDYLDEYGNPYSPLEPDRITGNADTLTSQYINLEGLSASDSVIMTFFYQPVGLGDFLTTKDSLKLEFKINDSSWTRIWSVGGGDFSEFIKVSVRINEARFLKSGFQFRFTNKTYQWGNNNHWHVDYIFIDQNRTMTDLDFLDYTIQSKPTSLLKNYYAMPYIHFLENPSAESSDSIYFRVGNRESVAIQAEVRHVETWNGVTLVSTNFPTNQGNVPAEGGALRRMKSYDFSSLTGDTVVIKRNYYVQKVNVLNEKIFQRNDSISVEQRFENFFAMDDGTAESSFGFNDLKRATGNMVVKFTLNRPDTLRAIKYFFTPNVSDPSKYLITLKIWQEIAVNGGTDQVLWDSTILLPDFSTEGFGEMMFFPEPMLLPAGEFYIGWEQEDDFNISIGFDKNNGYLAGTPQANKNIYYNIGDGWIQNSNKLLAGAPMIRAYVGSDFRPAGTGRDVDQKLEIFPNPANSEIQIKDIDLDEWSVTDMRGIVLLRSDEHSLEGKVNVSSLPNGVYILTVRSKNTVLNQKLVIQH